MFLKNSRYYGLPTIAAKDRNGRDVTAVTLRRLPATPGDEVTVTSSDRVDIVADARYSDATRYWHIADANSELDAEDLTQQAGRVIVVPQR